MVVQKHERRTPLKGRGSSYKTGEAPVRVIARPVKESKAGPGSHEVVVKIDEKQRPKSSGRKVSRSRKAQKPKKIGNRRKTSKVGRGREKRSSMVKRVAQRRARDAKLQTGEGGGLGRQVELVNHLSFSDNFENIAPAENASMTALHFQIQ